MKVDAAWYKMVIDDGFRHLSPEQRSQIVKHVSDNDDQIYIRINAEIMALATAWVDAQNGG